MVFQVFPFFDFFFRRRGRDEAVAILFPFGRLLRHHLAVKTATSVYDIQFI